MLFGTDAGPRTIGDAGIDPCGFYWTGGQFVDPSVDHTSGAGESMNVLGAVMSLLIGDAAPPVTNKTGGISLGDEHAGAGSNNYKNEPKPITTADKAGAGILTCLLLGGVVGMFAWMSLD